MFDFDTVWSDEVAEITQSREFQTIDVLMQDWSGVTWGDRDFVTGVRTRIGDPVDLYAGQARLVAISAAAVVEGGELANATTVRSIRIQIPQHAVGRVQRGMSVRVTSAPHNPSLTSYVFVINSDIQGGSAATRTFEAGVDADSAWAV